ncbi:hypothetical protein [Flavobacterium poyangense]|uniref:hypothetical protein n=1 Tax=Flavobacterium poyangense TaxID=2204302 RepID=UPI00142241AF|nr:hypothetical protein [Flavobacterium sp. JXAS1]
MGNTAKLFVPMYMEALVLSSDKDDCLDLGPQLKNYDQSILGNVLQPDTNQEVTLKKGIHLHWTLPKALKHSFVKENEETKFPYVPNRWMIIRVQTSKGITAMPSRIWMIKSDEKNALKSNETAPNWIVLKDNKLDFSNLGKAVEWSSDYTEETEQPILTGVGALNPYFASFYLSSKNVFGFHDDMKEVEANTTFTYVVAGWYSDPTVDPIGSGNFNAGTDADAEQKRVSDWFKQQWKCDQEAYPDSCLLHASIHSVQWNADVRSGVPDGEVQVYAGNTAVEALSAQIIKSSGKEKSGLEELMNALQYQLLDDNRNEPGLKSIQTEIHKRGFTPKNRGFIWEIVRAEATDQDLESKQEERAHFPENSSILSEFNALNQTQIICNRINQEVASLQQEYYFLWYKEARKTVRNAKVKDFDYVALRAALLDQLVAKKVERDALNTETRQQVASLKMYKELSGEQAEFELKEKLEDRFWEPNDPVLLFCGSGIGDTAKPGFQISDKEIFCRTEEQLLTKLYLNVPYNATVIPVSIPATAFDVPKVKELDHENIPFEGVKALVYETLLLDQALSVDIALAAYTEAQLEEGKDKKSPVIKSFAKTVVAKQLKPDYDEKEKAHEPFSITKWSQAWSPLFMVWEADYISNTPNIRELDLIENTDQWKLQDRLHFKMQSAVGTGQSIPVNGISPFSSSVFANLKRVLPDSIVNKYGNLNLVAQALSGLHKILVMQSPDIQFPPFQYTSDRINNFATDYLIDQEELNVIGEDGYKLGCNPGNVNGTDGEVFNPLRSGFIKIKKLLIVDVFGQVKKVIVDKDAANPTITAAVTLRGDLESSGTIIPLPPRIIQPSRLQFNWLNAKDEIIYQDTGKTDNPVLGWLVPNYLDKSILVYDGDGKEVLMLRITTDSTKDNGLQLLKSPFPGGHPIPDLAANPQLKKLLDMINKGSIASGIMDLAYKISANLTGNTALQNNTAALLCGQPLALVRCSIGLELLGSPYNNQRWDKSGKEDIGGIDTVNFPLAIGDYSMEKEGLVGYFTDVDGTAFYTAANAPEFIFSSDAFFKKGAIVKLALHQEPLKVTLLMDPSAGVHLATGILPTKQVTLFDHNSSRLLSQLNIGFMVAPFIAEKVAPDIPIPTSINANWKWTHKSDVVTWQDDVALAEGKNKQISGFKKQQVYEGWLRLNNLKTNN